MAHYELRQIGLDGSVTRGLVDKVNGCDKVTSLYSSGYLIGFLCLDVLFEMLQNSVYEGGIVRAYLYVCTLDNSIYKIMPNVSMENPKLSVISLISIVWTSLLTSDLSHWFNR